MLYATNLWPRTFVVPQTENEMDIAIQVWLDVLGDFEPELVRAAMAGWADHWPPTPNELRGVVLERRDLESGVVPPPSADAAWLEFKTGYRFDDDWSHPAVAATARSLGCKAFGNSPEADEMAWRAHFIKLYDVAVKRHRKETSPLPPILARRTPADLELMRGSVEELGMGDL